MFDLVERLRTAASNNRAQAERGTTTTGEILTLLGCLSKRTVAEMHTEAADEIDRLRSLLKEAGDALEAVPMPGGTTSWQGWKLAFLAWHEHTARTVLSKIKGEA